MGDFQAKRARLEHQKVKERAGVIAETRCELGKEKCVLEAQQMLYGALGICENRDENGCVTNFKKGVIDENLLWNIELAVEILKTEWTIILDALKHLMTWDGIKETIETCGENIASLFTGDAYERGKSLASLGLIATGLWATAYLIKKWVTGGIKKMLKKEVKEEAKEEAKEQVKEEVSGQAKQEATSEVPKTTPSTQNPEPYKVPTKEIAEIIDRELASFPEIQQVLKAMALDTDHKMNTIAFLADPATRGRTLRAIRELHVNAHQPLTLEEMRSLTLPIAEKSSPLFRFENMNRYEELKQRLMSEKRELYEIGEVGDDTQKRRLEEYVRDLNHAIEPALVSKLQSLTQDLPHIGGFPQVQSRVKSATGLEDKISRMRQGNAWRTPRPEYSLADMPDAVGGRIVVGNIRDLEAVMERMEATFGKENIYEIDNFYSSAKRERPYRVITYAVNVDWVPCEVQLQTLRSTIAWDLWHNTGYKPLLDVGEESLQAIWNLERNNTRVETTLLQ